MKKFTSHTREKIANFSGTYKEAKEIFGVSKSYYYKLKHMHSIRASFQTKSSHPHTIRFKPLPSPNIQPQTRTNIKNCGHQRCFLQLTHDYPDLKLSERDIRKIYQQHNWFKKQEKKPIQQYEKKNPGDLAHNNIKYLPKVGDDSKRLYFQEVLIMIQLVSQLQLYFMIRKQR